MPLPSSEGRYIAKLTNRKVDEYNGTPTFDARFECQQYFDGAEWCDVQGNPSIERKWFLKKKDGTWNTFALESFMDSFGWDPAKGIAGLSDPGIGEPEVQITIGYKDATDGSGKQYMEVKFLNPRDYTGSGHTLVSDPGTVQSLEQKYGAEIRAVMKQVRQGKTAPAAKPVGQQITDDWKMSAWKLFVEKSPSMSSDQRKDVWYRMVKDITGKDAKDASINWSQVASEIAKHGAYTYNDAPAIPDESLPF